MKRVPISINKKIYAFPLYLFILSLPFTDKLIFYTNLPRFMLVIFFSFSTCFILSLNYKFEHITKQILFFMLGAIFFLTINSTITVFINHLTKDQMTLKIVFTNITQPLLMLFAFIMIRYTDSEKLIVKLFIFIGLIISIFNIGFAMGVLPQTGLVLEARSVLGFTLPFQRSTAIAFNMYKFGLLSEIAMAFLIPVLLFNTGMNRSQITLVLIFILTILVSLIITQDRSIWLTVVFIIGISVFHLIRNRVVKNTLLFMLFIAFCFQFSFLFSSMVEVGERTVYGRWATIKIALHEFAQHPAFGIGWDMFGIQNERGKVLHNSFVALLAFYGLFGFVCHMAIIIYFFYLCRRVFIAAKKIWIQRLSFGCFLSMISWAIENNFNLGVRGFELWIIFSLIGTLYVKNKQFSYLGSK
jgi:hypothetical protein